MSVIDRQLVRAVNSGRCFCLVGAGPSCELGMPSWRQLAENVLRKACNIQAGELAEQGQELLDQCNYPRLFSLAEKTIGQQRLLELVSEQLPGNLPLGRVYQYITAWPFQSYLTTNFDDQLNRHLEAVGRAFVTRRNKQDDLRVLHSVAKDVVFKIHGDTSVPDDIVLTAEQYDDFRRGARRQYWRDSILSLLKMVDLVIVGYALRILTSNRNSNESRISHRLIIRYSCLRLAWT